jgi:hypothetical protein
LAKFLITTPFFSITKAGGLLPVFQAVTVSRTCTTRRCPRAGRYCQPRLSRLNSTATKSSRRRSRSKRSHLLRSRSPRQSRPKSPPHRVRCTVRRPDPDKLDPGQIIEASYTVTGNLLRVFDDGERELGVETIQPGDDAEPAARKVLREKHGKHLSFYNRISYRDHVI